jgi:hypothetical protein
LLLTTPWAVVTLVFVAKLISVVLVGNWIVTDYARRDTVALDRDVKILRVFNVIDPAKAYYADGDRAVLQNRLSDADHQFSQALEHIDPARSCPARVNLELVRETLGDRAAAAADRDGSVSRYTAAATLVRQAPGGCFGGNSDPDPARRQIRADTLHRLQAKIEAQRPRTAQSTPPPALPPPPPLGTATAPSSTAPEPPSRADPSRDDPMAGLEQILRDGAG